MEMTKWMKDRQASRSKARGLGDRTGWRLAGASDGIRTHDLLFTKQLLYP